MAKTKYPQPTTGYAANGGVVMLGESNPVSGLNSVSCNRPKNNAILATQGDLPTDASDARTPTVVSVSLFEGSLPLFSCSADMAIQGQSTANDQRKGYSLKFRNADTQSKLSVQIGDWLPVTKLDVKSYPLDRTYSRDTFCAWLWRTLRRSHDFPGGSICPQSVMSSAQAVNNGMQGGALFSTDGFIVSHVHNGAFMGLYVLRTTGDTPDYLMDTTNPNHIMIQPNHAGNIWSTSFDSTQWAISSPDIAGYDDYDDISNTAPDVDAKCARLIQWFLNVNAGTVNMRATSYQYINLDSWIDYILMCEIVGSCDSITNNFQLCTWNGSVWYLCAYDMDETIGVITKGDRPTNDPAGMELIMDYLGSGAAQSNIFRLFYKYYTPEIRAAWRKLRDSGVVASKTFDRRLNEIVQTVSPSAFADDLAASPKSTADLSNFTTAGTSSMPYMMDWLQKRIAWLDVKWGYSG
ncbi:CotH kinase family protein [Acetobacter malorum]|uniref:CotH kinase family protein n=1 Tax=Acetobacter malorum TaxID=178901 RepID=UPI0039EB9CCC